MSAYSINARHIYEFCQAESFWMEGLELENQWRYLRNNFPDVEARTLAEGLTKWRDTRPTLLAQLFPHLEPEELQAAVEQMDKEAQHESMD